MTFDKVLKIIVVICVVVFICCIIIGIKYEFSEERQEYYKGVQQHDIDYRGCMKSCSMNTEAPASNCYWRCRG